MFSDILISIGYKINHSLLEFLSNYSDITKNRINFAFYSNYSVICHAKLIYDYFVTEKHINNLFVLEYFCNN